MDLIALPYGNYYIYHMPTDFKIFPLSITNIAHFPMPKSISISLIKACIVFPTKIYRLTPNVSLKLFRFFSIWLIIITPLSFLIQFPIKLSLIILKHSILLNLSTLSSYLLTFAEIASFFCFNLSITTPSVFTLILCFFLTFTNVLQY